MQTILSAAVLLLAAVASAVSTTGNRLLVVLDNVAEKDDYKQFFGDLTGKLKEQEGLGLVPSLTQMQPIGKSADSRAFLLQTEATRSHTRHREAIMSSYFIWGSGHMTTWFSCRQKSRVSHGLHA